MDVRQAVQQARLYGILDLGYVDADKAISVAQRVLEGGVGVLQLRGKKQSIDLLGSLGRDLAALCRQYQVPFIINDYPELVEATRADGVHIGQDDMSVAEARARLGPEAIVGKSTHSLDQVRVAQREQPDYIGFGPLFSTATKPDYVPIGVADIAEAHRLISCPIFCIGGIKRENLAGVMDAGATRVVIVSGILQAEDPAKYGQDCRAFLEDRFRRE